MTKDKTVVVFRKFKDGGDILALFPEIVYDPQGNCMSYQHTGQHGVASVNIMDDVTEAASPSEYADLKLELESLIGYDLDVRSEVTKEMNAKRATALRDYKLSGYD